MPRAETTGMAARVENTRVHVIFATVTRHHLVVVIVIVHALQRHGCETALHVIWCDSAVLECERSGTHLERMFPSPHATSPPPPHATAVPILLTARI